MLAGPSVSAFTALLEVSVCGFDLRSVALETGFASGLTFRSARRKVTLLSFCPRLFLATATYSASSSEVGLSILRHHSP
uniref:Putative secreted protein n=1 Tax=Ixodes ricinus TaxID=34613 RepID=A0A6B0TV73_IXORI